MGLSQLTMSKILGFRDKITNPFRWKFVLVVTTLTFLCNDP